MSGALAVLQAHVAEYEFDGEIADAVAAFADLLNTGEELIAAQAHYDAIDCPGGRRWDRLALAREQHAAAIARCNGGAV